MPLAFAERHGLLRPSWVAARAPSEPSADASSALPAGEQRDAGEQAEAWHNLASSLWVVNQELRRELETAQSQLPQINIAYDQLKEAFFEIQGRLAVASRELQATRAEATRLRRRAARCALCREAGRT